MKLVYISCIILMLDLPLYSQVQNRDQLLNNTVYNFAPENLKKSKAFIREWNFFQQRAYPNNHIPLDAYSNAMLQKVALRRQNPNSSQNINSVQNLTWVSLGPSSGSYYNYGNISSRVVTGTYHPTDPNIIYIGAADGGVWKSTDGGTTWIPLTDNQASMSMGAIVIDPVNPNIIYAGTGEPTYSIVSYYGRGLLKSTDAGNTWTQITSGLPASSYFSRLIIRPNHNSELLAALSGSGLYRSTNAGQSWSLIYSGRCDDAVFSPSGDTAFAVGAAIGFLRSVNGGANFSPFGSGLPTSSNYFDRIQMDLCRSNTSVMYAAKYNGSTVYVYKSTNYGTSWSQLVPSYDFNGGQAWYDLYCKVNPVNPNIVFIGTIDVFRSTDGGANFSNVTNGYSGGNVHADNHYLFFNPTDPNSFFIGCDGGVWKSTDGGNSFSNLNQNLTLTQFYRIASSPFASRRILGGTQDNGTQHTNANVKWQAIYGGDGGDVSFNPFDPNYILGETQNGGLFRTSDGGNNWGDATSGLNTGENVTWVAPIIAHPTISGTFYSARQKVYKTTDNGATWSALSLNNVNGTNPVREMAISNSNPSVLYASSANSVFKSADGGVNWTLASTGLPNATVTTVFVHPSSSDIAFVTVSGFGSPHIYKTTNGGGSWTSISGNLPDAPANTFYLYSAGLDQYTYFLGTDVGIFYSQDNGTTWTETYNGLPNTVMMHLDYQPLTNTLRIGTHGRGVYEAYIGQAPITSINENFDSGTMIPTGWITAQAQYINGTAANWVFTSPLGIGRMGSGTLATAFSFPNIAAFNSYSAGSGNEARLITPILDFTAVSSPLFTFRFSDIYDSYKDSMIVDGSTDGGSSWTALATFATRAHPPATNTWLAESVNISAYANKSNVRFAFRGHSNYGYNFGIDNVSIGPPASDVGITAINLPSFTAFKTTNTITTSITNFGTNNQLANTFNVTVKIWKTSGGSESSPEFTKTDACTTAISGGNTGTYSFSTQWTPAAYTAYTVKVFTALTGDEVSSNDAFTKTVNVVPQTDLQISSIVYPPMTDLNTGTLGYSVACTIKNNGNSAVGGTPGAYIVEAWVGLTSGFPADADHFSYVATPPGIGTGATSGTLNLLPTWVPGVPGNYTVRFKVTIAGDELTSNDTLTEARIVSSYNYGGGGSGTGGYYYANTTVEATTYAPSHPTYSWFDPVSAGHTLLTSWASGNADDGYSSAIILPFSFSYFGNSYSGIYIGSNGIVTFGVGSSSSIGYLGIPNISVPNNLIAGAWTDLDNTTATYSDAHIYYGGDANKFVVTFWHTHNKGSATDYITYQIIMFPNGNIKIQYNDTETTNPLPISVVNNCSIGIENSDGTLGLQYRNAGTGGAMFGSPLAVEFGPNSSAFSAMSLSLTTLFEAMWVSGGESSMPNPAPVAVELHDASTFALLEAQTGTLSTAGVGTFTFTTAVNGMQYYIAVKSPTTIETWSAAAHSFTAGALSYDFTSGVGQAYTDGSMDPLKSYSGKYCIYSGDANQDGFVTSDDFTGIDNDVNLGDYHVENDLNGDLFITSDDFTFVDNNISTGVMRQVPPGAPDHLIKQVKSPVQHKSSVTN